MNVTVVGQGRVGLTAAVYLALAGQMRQATTGRFRRGDL